MARVELAPFIKSISGKVGNLEFRTLRSGKVVVHSRRMRDANEKRVMTRKEIAHQRRFGIVSRVTAAVQKSYPRIDEAARARQKIWNRVGRHYDKMIGAHPEYTDQEMERALIKEIGNKAGKESVKSRLCRTKGGKPRNASERTK